MVKTSLKTKKNKPNENNKTKGFNPKLNEILFFTISRMKLGIPPNKADKIITNPNLFIRITISRSKIIFN